MQRYTLYIMICAILATVCLEVLEFEAVILSWELATWVIHISFSYLFARDWCKDYQLTNPKEVSHTTKWYVNLPLESPNNSQVSSLWPSQPLRYWMFSIIPIGMQFLNDHRLWKPSNFIMSCSSVMWACLWFQYQTFSTKPSVPFRHLPVYL